MTGQVWLRDAQVGDALPPYVKGPISRATLALFAGASHDHAPMHLDVDAARAAGMPDVFAHGMLSMAYLGQALRNWAPQEAIRSFNVRFIAITPIHAVVHCFGEVVEIFEQDSERCARLTIGTRTGEGVQTLSGEAVVAIE